MDKIIGRFYPFFGALLVFMSLGLVIGLAVRDHGFFSQGLEFGNLHPNDLPLWPLLFITMACGAVSGFHATQSPLMARCMENEKSGRFIFYGAMIGEGVIALIWCALGLSFYDSTEALNATLANGARRPWYTKSRPRCWASSGASWRSWAWWCCPSPRAIPRSAVPA